MDLDNLTGGVYSYAGKESSWTGVGKAVGKFMTLDEAMTAAAIPYNVVKEQLAVPFDDGTYQLIDAWGTFDPDTGHFFGVVGKDYSPYGWREKFEIGQDFVNAQPGAYWETMGRLGKNGAIAWGQINLKQAFDVLPGDEHQCRLTIVSAHCPTAGGPTCRAFAAISFLQAITRVQCVNTCMMAFNEGNGNRLKVIHKGNLQAKMADVKAALADLKSSQLAVKDKLQFLARKKVTPELLDAVAVQLLGPKPELKSNATEKEEQKLVDWNQSYMQVLEHTSMPMNTPRGSDGSVYQLWNGVTSAANHGTLLRERGGQQARAEAVMFSRAGESVSDLLDVLVDKADKLPDLFSVAAKSQPQASNTPLLDAVLN